MGQCIKNSIIRQLIRSNMHADESEPYLYYDIHKIVLKDTKVTDSFYDIIERFYNEIKNIESKTNPFVASLRDEIRKFSPYR